MSLEEEYVKHPYDPECVCKLCDWRREAILPKTVFEDQPIPRSRFTATQQAALHNICRSNEDVKAAWDKPRIFNVPSLPGRMAFVVTCVVKDDHGYHWMSCIRIYIAKKKRVKVPEVWNQLEKTVAAMILTNELMGVGPEDPNEREEFYSQWALHIKTKVTSKELGEALRPDILSGNGRKPGVTTSQDEAKKMLDKAEKDLEDGEKPRIILPNQN